jgi:alpha-beta hydrolase superfamily lysophospholipase
LRSFGKWLGRGIAILILLGVGLWAFGPYEPVTRSGPFTADVSDPDAYFSQVEAAFDDITDGAEKRIVWFGAVGGVTPISVVYLHGFSATSEEVRPLPDQVAQALGANLVYTRLRGHGRTGAAMAEATAGDWINDTAEALAVARQVGGEVLILSTSTGGTLAAIAATEPDLADRLAGIVFISPNFGLSNPLGALLTWPAARYWAGYVVGHERSFPTSNELHATYWTSQYPTVATLPMGALVQNTVARDFSGVDVPALFLFNEADRVVSATVTREIAQRWGAPATIIPQTLPAEGADPWGHVLAGDALSPAMTEPMTAVILEWFAQGRG